MRDKQSIINQKRNTSVRQCEVGDKVQFKQFRNNKSFWGKGIIMKRLGSVSYEVRRNDKLYKNHINHIIARTTHTNYKQDSMSEKNVRDNDISDFNLIPCSNPNSSGIDELKDTENTFGDNENNESRATSSNLLHNN